MGEKSMKKKRNHLTKFHADHKYILKIHNFNEQKELGRLLAQWKFLDMTPDQIADEYYSRFFRAILSFKHIDEWAKQMQQMFAKMKLPVFAEPVRDPIRTSIKKFGAGDASKSESQSMLALGITLGKTDQVWKEKNEGFCEQNALLHPYPRDLRLDHHVPPESKSGGYKRESPPNDIHQYL